MAYKDDDLMQMDLYTILQIPQTASNKDINRQKRKLSLKHHPDRNQNNPESTRKFMEIIAVAEFLVDANKRQKYDERLKAKAYHKAREEKQSGTARLFREKLRREEAAMNDRVVEEAYRKHKMRLEKIAREDGYRLVHEEEEVDMAWYRGREKDMEERLRVNKKEALRKEGIEMLDAEDVVSWEEHMKLEAEVMALLDKF